MNTHHPLLSPLLSQLTLVCVACTLAPGCGQGPSARGGASSEGPGDSLAPAFVELVDVPPHEAQPVQRRPTLPSEAGTILVGDSYFSWNAEGPHWQQGPRNVLEELSGRGINSIAFPGAKWDGQILHVELDVPQVPNPSLFGWIPFVGDILDGVVSFFIDGVNFAIEGLNDSGLVDAVASAVVEFGLDSLGIFWDGAGEHWSIRDQYMRALERDGMQRIILTAGGNDLLDSPEGVECQDGFEGDDSLLSLSDEEMPLPPASCRAHIEGMVEVFRELLDQTVGSEIQEIYYVAYPRVPARVELIPALSYGLGLVREAATYAETLGIEVHIIDLRRHFEDAEGAPRRELYECYDPASPDSTSCDLSGPLAFGPLALLWQLFSPEIHPTVAGSRIIGEAMWDLMRGPLAPEGALDVLAEDGSLSGWAYDPNNEGVELEVELLVDGVEVAVVVAGEPRPDLNASADIVGPHGFSVRIPDAHRDGGVHQAELRLRDAEGVFAPRVASRFDFRLYR